MNTDSTPSHSHSIAGKVSPPFWFWLITLLAFLWFLMDVSAFFYRVLTTEETRLTMDQTQRYLHRAHPLWVNTVFALEVFGGALGCVALLLKKPWALHLYYISLFGVISQTFYVYFISDAIAVVGTPAIAMPMVAIFVGISMIWFTRSCLLKLWFD